MKTVIKKRGRKPTLAPILNKKILLFGSKTVKEISDIVFPEIRPNLKGGINGDEKAQRFSVLMGCYKFKSDRIKEGKNLNFRGRLVKDAKGNEVRKTRYVHAKKAEVKA